MERYFVCSFLGIWIWYLWAQDEQDACQKVWVDGLGHHPTTLAKMFGLRAQELNRADYQWACFSRY